MRIFRGIVVCGVTVAVLALTAPPASSNTVCKYYWVQHPITRENYMFDLTWCGI